MVPFDQLEWNLTAGPEPFSGTTTVPALVQ